MSNLTYTEPQARLIRKRAAQEAFQTEDGNPDFAKLAAAAGCHRDAAVFILTGDFPGKAEAKGEELLE